VQAVQRINAAGAVVVAAAGNDAGLAVGTPANCAGVIGVGGLRHAGSKVGFSDLGPEIALSAPGGNCVFDSDVQPCSYPILAGSNTGSQRPGSSAWTDSFNYGVGTSFSAPIVAGAAALVLSARPQLTPPEVRQVLQSTVRPFPTDGATNLPLDNTPVPVCRPPDGNEQLQCYCKPGLCGTGMLDAAAAAAGAEGAFARIVQGSATARAGTEIIFDAGDSLAALGRTVIAYRWRISDGGGIVNGFVTASNVQQVGVLPSAAGSFILELTVTDDQGASAVTQTTVVVAAAAGGGGGGGGGGGASHPLWLLGLLVAAAALRRVRDRG
jgi:serine protease